MATYLQGRINFLPEPLQSEGLGNGRIEDGDRGNQSTNRTSSPKESAEDVAAGRR